MTLSTLSVCCYFKHYLLALRSFLGRSSKLRLVNIVLGAAMTRTHKLRRLHLNIVFWSQLQDKRFVTYILLSLSFHIQLTQASVFQINHRWSS